VSVAAFGWRDGLDVLLVALLIYCIFTLFRGTRAMQMLVGVGVLVAGSLVARQLELHSLSWLLDTLWSFWVVVLVVLFQPELRRALTGLGHAAALRPLFGGAGAETLRVVDEIASVAGGLADRRIGALIVIERGTGLRQYAELGVALDALVSADLLTSLFLPYSPLHDGAAFIRDNRVVAAGCFLPLSRNSQLARQLGTRHRAALGVTEETDAVAVVVSEETGRLSIAVDGGIETLGGPDAVRRRLLTLLGGPRDRVPAFGRGWLRAMRLRARPAEPPSSPAP
jgi:diadenylate cyclase